jgi:hypothetical protein
MKTLFLNCVLFTLADQEVAENKYIPIFRTWLSKLIQNGGLSRDDFLLISIDERTMQHLTTNSGILGTLLSYLNCPYAFKIFPAPATLLDGMKIRYTPHEFKQDVYMYMDIDILVLKSMRPMLERTMPYQLYVCTEGTLKDENYGADMSASDDPGYTSGIFMATAPYVQELLFRKVLEIYADKSYYTQDQPYYNKAVYSIKHNNILLTPLTSFNGHGYDRDITVFFNCGGEPGRGKIHYDKIHEIICLLNVGFF